MKCKRCGKEMEIAHFNGEDYYVCHDCRVRRKIQHDVPMDYKDEDKKEPVKKNKLSIPLLISFIIGAAYLVYFAVVWSGTASEMDGWEQVGAGIATVLVAPHVICTFIAVIFNALGLFLRKRGFALTGAILYTVAMVLFPVYFMFVIIETILSYVGFSKMKKK